MFNISNNDENIEKEETRDSMTIIQKFLQAEINEQQLYKAIVEFIDSYEIRSGEFEGNE